MTDLPGLPSRRSFLKATAAGAALSGFAVGANARTVESPIPLDQYTPEYFTADEWTFILAAVARLIPSEGDGPGAIEARVPVFIDRELRGGYGEAADWYMEGPHQPDADPFRGWQTPLTPAEVYRGAIPAFDAWCRDTHGAGFADLDPTLQDAALTALQKGEVTLDPTLKNFFSILIANTKEGYFADPIYGGNHGMQSWTYIGFPGARANFKEWVLRYNIPYPLGPVSIKGERA